MFLFSRLTLYIGFTMSYYFYMLRHFILQLALKNVNDRIKLLFGIEYGLKILSIKNSGTEINVVFPRKI